MASFSGTVSQLLLSHFRLECFWAPGLCSACLLVSLRGCSMISDTCWISGHRCLPKLPVWALTFIERF